MKRIATITFHSSHNYGSCLQAYALQEFVKKIYAEKCIYNIINLRTYKQKEMYNNYSSIRRVLKSLLLFPYLKQLSLKQRKFEDFINNKLQITREYYSLDDIKNDKLNYDVFIAGSDQLWNINAYDFDWSYYLEFVKDSKKISYAASFGDKPIKWNEEDKNRIKNDLLSFDSISVREKGSFNNVKELTNIEPNINVDPTMLLSVEEWNNIILNDRIVKDKYIFLYSLKKDKKTIMMAKDIGKKMNLPIVISKSPNQFELFGTKKVLDVGPIEFLNLIKNSELVISSSFHGNVFSIIFNKPFFAINGDTDFRISTLLDKMNLSNRAISFDNYKAKINDAYNIDFTEALELLNIERNKSMNYLKKAIDDK